MVPSFNQLGIDAIFKRMGFESKMDYKLGDWSCGSQLLEAFENLLLEARGVKMHPPA